MGAQVEARIHELAAKQSAGGAGRDVSWSTLQAGAASNGLCVMVRRAALGAGRHFYPLHCTPIPASHRVGTLRGAWAPVPARQATYWALSVVAAAAVATGHWALALVTGPALALLALMLTTTWWAVDLAVRIAEPYAQAGWR